MVRPKGEVRTTGGDAAVGLAVLPRLRLDLLACHVGIMIMSRSHTACDLRLDQGRLIASLRQTAGQEQQQSFRHHSLSHCDLRVLSTSHTATLLLYKQGKESLLRKHSPKPVFLTCLQAVDAPG